MKKRRVNTLIFENIRVFKFIFMRLFFQSQEKYNRVTEVWPSISPRHPKRRVNKKFFLNSVFSQGKNVVPTLFNFYSILEFSLIKHSLCIFISELSLYIAKKRLYLINGNITKRTKRSIIVPSTCCNNFIVFLT